MPGEFVPYHPVFYRYKRVSVGGRHYSYPRGLTITVYLNRRGVEKNEPVCEIDFRTEEYREDWDIKNNVEHFQLYLDGKELIFYINEDLGF